MKIPVLNISDFKVKDLEKGKIHRFWIEILSDELGNPIVIPVMVARGVEDLLLPFMAMS